jgi:hypothetical protein
VNDPHEEYERRLAARRGRIAALDRVNFTISNIRLALALAGGVLLWMAVVRGSVSAAWPLAAGLSFGVVALIHATRLQRFERAKAAERVYIRGLDRLDGRRAGGGRDGASFLADHPYAGDLDLFGRASLFELLNTTRTEIGELTLADWLRGPAPLPEVRARQAAVDELGRCSISRRTSPSSRRNRLSAVPGCLRLGRLAGRALRLRVAGGARRVRW